MDWASRSHHVCVTDRDGGKTAEKSFPHGGDGLFAMAEWIEARVGADVGRIAVAIEIPHGPVVEGLVDRGFEVHSINPKQLDRFRDRFSPAGAKDDSKDALVLASALRTDRHCFRKVDPSDPAVIEIRQATRTIGELKEDRVRIAHRIREQLWRYYPAILEASKNVCEPWVMELWKRAPTPQQGQRIRLGTLEALLKKHRIRRLGAEELHEILGATPMHVVPGVATAATKYVRSAFERLALLRKQIREAEEDVARIVDGWIGDEEASDEPGEQRDVTILSSLPGVGRTVLATLLAEAPDLVERRDYKALRCLAGVAPVTRRSGKSVLVIRRLAAHPRLREAVHHWSRVAVQRDPLSKAKYAALRARGHSHGRALRSVADRLLAVACAMLRTQTSFEFNHGTERDAA